MNKRIPFVDLTRQYPLIKEELDQVYEKVLASAQFVGGEDIEFLEREFAEYCGVKNAVAVASGTAALHLTLLSNGISRGDEVITAPNTFMATVEAIFHTGATPVFVDIDPYTYDLDHNKLEAAISTKTKAILPVHLHGHPADMENICRIAEKHNLKVICDCCQSHGAMIGGKKISNFGDADCYSFFPNKNLGGVGDGGIIVTDDNRIADNLRLLRNHGRTEKFEHLIVGYNSRLDSLQAGFLRVKLKYLDKWVEARRNNASIYNRLLEGIPGITLPIENPGYKHVYHLYVIRSDKRDQLKENLDKQKILTGIHYPIALHMQPACSHLGYKQGDFPEAEKAAEEILSLPFFPELTPEEIKTVTNAIKKFQQP